MENMETKWEYMETKSEDLKTKLENMETKTKKVVVTISLKAWTVISWKMKMENKTKWRCTKVYSPI